MGSQTPAHDFLLPRLAALVAEAEQDGIDRDVAVAVLIDLVTSSPFNTTKLDPTQDTEPGRVDYAYDDDLAQATDMTERVAHSEERGSQMDPIRGTRIYRRI